MVDATCCVLAYLTQKHTMQQNQASALLRPSSPLITLTLQGLTQQDADGSRLQACMSPNNVGSVLCLLGCAPARVVSDCMIEAGTLRSCPFQHPDSCCVKLLPFLSNQLSAADSRSRHPSLAMLQHVQQHACHPYPPGCSPAYWMGTSQETCNLLRHTTCRPAIVSLLTLP